MRRQMLGLVGAVVLGLTVGEVGFTAATAMPGPRCAPRGAHVIRRDAQAEVYELEDDAPLEVFGCLRGRRRVSTLGPFAAGSPEGASGIDHVTLTGGVVAYEELSLPGEKGGENPELVWLVIVRDLTNGRIVRRLPTGAAPAGTKAIGAGSVVRLVLKANGSVAWTTEYAFGPLSGPHTYQVRAVDKTGNRLLASGTDVRPKSLKLRGSALSWVKGGRVSSTTLR
jgi:hypothetical protein